MNPNSRLQNWENHWGFQFQTIRSTSKEMTCTSALQTRRGTRQQCLYWCTNPSKDANLQKAPQKRGPPDHNWPMSYPWCPHLFGCTVEFWITSYGSPWSPWSPGWLASSSCTNGTPGNVGAPRESEMKMIGPWKRSGKTVIYRNNICILYMYVYVAYALYIYMYRIHVL